MVWHRKAVVIQAAVRGWLARTRYSRLRGAVVYLQCCWRRARARQELRRLRVEARSLEHYKQLHKGMEIKVIQLQCRLDEEVGPSSWPPGPGGSCLVLAASHPPLGSQHRPHPCPRSSPSTGVGADPA